jgi:hypothetical protein
MKQTGWKKIKLIQINETELMESVLSLWKRCYTSTETGRGFFVQCYI